MMSDRDKFAKAALTGFTAALCHGLPYDLDLLAKQVYEIADAMLRQREKCQVSSQENLPPTADIVDRAEEVWANPFAPDADPRALLLEPADEIKHLRTVNQSLRLKVLTLRKEIVRLRESKQKRLDEIVADMPRWNTLTLAEQLRDRGVAMKNVPMFAVHAMSAAADEIARLRLAIRRLAEQDATLSVQGGNVIVEMDATLTDAELKAVRTAAFAYAQNDDDAECAETAARLLEIAERMK